MRDLLGDTLAAAVASLAARDGASLERAILARIGGPFGQAAREAIAQLASANDRERRLQRTKWAVAARAPIPPGLRGIDPSWIEAALAGLPARAREAVAGNPQDPASVWLARWACAAFPPMPAIDPALATPATPADAARLAPAALRAWLEDIGADELAFALGAQARELLKTGTGPISGLADRLARAIEKGPVPSWGDRTDRRAAIERAKVELDERALMRIGARAVAPQLPAIDRRRIVLRLPRELGRVIADEMRAYGVIR